MKQMTSDEMAEQTAQLTAQQRAKEIMGLLDFLFTANDLRTSGMIGSTVEVKVAAAIQVAVDAERERCALLADELNREPHDTESIAGKRIADAIRALKGQP